MNGYNNQTKVLYSTVENTSNSSIGVIMPFKRSKTPSTVFETPYDLFKSLSGRKFADLMTQQKETLNTYLSDGLDKSDVAMQLPTGSGKTLVGLLIAEWRRRKFNEKIVYLCPTIQLVNQTAIQARLDHKINVVAFTGRKTDYLPEDITAYQTGRSIAVTTYSSIFNAKSFFSDANVLILDDAHSAENYIAKTWSLEIDARDKKRVPMLDAVIACLKPVISLTDYARLSGRWSRKSDSNWYDKLPTPKLFEISDELIRVLDTHAFKSNQKFPWMMIRDHINACQVYLSSNGILIRPLIPPTWELDAFSSPKQRIFMSATLGNGGDLERLTGRKMIHRLPVPADFIKQGIGRKFFLFPEMKMSPDKADELRLELLELAGRGVIITPTGKECERIADAIRSHIGAKSVFDAKAIESSKEAFTSKENAAVVMANRYDGVDFPNEESRFLCVDGLPRAMNAQENFIMSRMGSRVLFNERIQTRVMQAVGRCTRSLQDYSAVMVTGRELQYQLTAGDLISHFPSELQSELNFGIDVSMNSDKDEVIENFKLFLEHGESWQEVNVDIIQDIDSREQKPFPALDNLENVVKYEIDYQKSLWRNDYSGALEAAKRVSTGLLDGSDLRGYRGLWFYLAGSAAYLAYEAGQITQQSAFREQYESAMQAARSISWLADLSNLGRNHTGTVDSDNQDLNAQLDNIERVLLAFGSKHDAQFEKFEAQILTGLTDFESFEQSHEKLGYLLGFQVGNMETSGAPDPYWITRTKCFVFEDHANADHNSVLSVSKARQVDAHPKWMTENIDLAQDKKIYAVLVSPVSKVDQGGHASLKNVSYWHLNGFIEWAKSALINIRALRADLTEVGDLEWRAKAITILEDNRMTSSTLVEFFNSSNAYHELEAVDFG